MSTNDASAVNYHGIYNKSNSSRILIGAYDLLEGGRIGDVINVLFCFFIV